MSDERELWTDDERRALGLWQAPEPAPDFCARVTAGLSEPARPWARAGAAAAVAVLLVGGALTLQQLARHGGPAGSAQMKPYDGGAAAEVSAAVDGLRS